MGNSAVGVMFWGFVFEEMDDSKGEYGEVQLFLQDVYDGWDEFYARKMGLSRPNIEWSEENKEIFSKYWSEQRKLVKESSCEIDRLGYHDEPFYGIYIKESYLTAGDWSFKEIPYEHFIDDISILHNWTKLLKEFCKVMEITWQEPKWYLTSYYG